MLTVEKFDRDRHLELLKEWTKAWDMPEYPWDYLPDHGWVAYDDDPVLLRKRPLACMMVRLCEKQTAMIDYLISAPDKNTQHRKLIQEGIGRMFREGEAFADAHDIKMVLGMTQYPRVVELANYFGFQTSQVTKLWRVT
jgi:hypothetical protein